MGSRVKHGQSCQGQQHVYKLVNLLSSKTCNSRPEDSKRQCNALTKVVTYSLVPIQSKI